MNSIRISIKANEETQEIMISELTEAGAEGFEQTSDHLIAYFPELNFNSYDVSEILKGLDYQTSIIEEQNWNELWEKNFPPVVIENFCVVRADFHKPVTTVPYEIIITPKMSFGTGHHATTYMMISRMKDIDFTNKEVFDFGTGTGILAILAEKLGAAKILAVDIDEWSIENAKENIERNQCSNIILERLERLPGHQFDIIIANINRNVILEHITDMHNCLFENGKLLLSGLLTTDENDIVKACAHLNLRLCEKSERNNWISLLFIKELGAVI